MVQEKPVPPGPPQLMRCGGLRLSSHAGIELGNRPSPVEQFQIHTSLRGCQASIDCSVRPVSAGCPSAPVTVQGIDYVDTAVQVVHRSNLYEHPDILRLENIRHSADHTQIN